MKKISFYKMSGAGNDFIVIDKNSNPGFVPDQNIVQKICNRRYGIGADGVITVADSNSYDFDMQYFNADGSTGSLCGNGARCAIKFADLSGRIKQETTKFLSNGVAYTGMVLNETQIKFFFNPPQKLKYNFKVKAFNQLINACYVDTGSPHVVIKIDDVLINPANPKLFYEDLNNFPVFELGREIRYHKDFAPEGANINFIKLVEGKIHIRTYERGVEDETLACGTGSTAAAVIGSSLFNLNPPVSLITRGGDELIVNFKTENQNIKDLSLTGPALVTFTGEFTIN
ncbi:MAG: diaminopimelate epimerase [Ignavibacteriaceae bacterium]|nr:diaminopimelate epimerase [Ignavibacteriaceae bacterium]